MTGSAIGRVRLFYCTCSISDISAALLQGITLVLSACCQLPHQPSEGLLEALAAAMGRSLSAFKRQELASCLDAFKALGFHPGNELIQVSLCRCTYALHCDLCSSGMHACMNLSLFRIARALVDVATCVDH